ncbi:MAG: single-stranded DNA-binding protein [Propionibacteriaceae bacterium]|nr:single-stranded DNA-binding protein [Propionibacteriaceae bacterium]
MQMDAQIWITGRVGTEVEYRMVKDIPFAQFRLGCTPSYNRNGQWNELDTTWLSVSCSRRLAEGVQESVKKGDPVVVTGRLRTDRWIDSQGVEHERLKLEATSVGHDLAWGTAVFNKRNNPDGAIMEAAAEDDRDVRAA